MNITHLCLITYKDDAAVDPSARAAIEKAYLSLPGIIDGITNMRVGHDLSLLDGNAHFAISATFRDRDAFLAYSTHPAHMDVIFPVVGPHMASYSTAQFGG